MAFASLIAMFLFPPLLVQQDVPSPTVSRAAFALRGPEGPVRGPITYQYYLYQPGEAEPLVRRGNANLTGTLVLPDPDVAEGRIELWVQADDGKAAWHSGYLSISYAKEAPDEPDLPVVPMRRGLVVTGKVVSAKDQQPLANTRVAPMFEGQHGLLYADWDRATMTGPGGEYRLTGSYIEGLATWAAEGQSEFSFAKGTPRQDAVLKVTPSVVREIRVVDPDGNAIVGATSQGAVGPTEEDGVLRVRLRTPSGAVLVSARGFESDFVEISDPPDTEPLIARLKRVRVVRGRIRNTDGSIPEKLRVWLKPGMGVLHQDYKSIDVQADGTWEFAHWSTPQAVSVSVLVDGVERAFHRFRIAEADARPGVEVPIELPVCPDVIVTTIGNGHDVTGRLVPAELVARYPNAVAIRLFDRNQHVVRAVSPDRQGRFVLHDVPDGKYEAQICSFNESARNAHWRMHERTTSVRQLFNDFSLDAGKPVKIPVIVTGDDVPLAPVRLTEVALLPGRISGVAKSDNGQPLAHYFVYVNDGFSMDTAGGTHHIARSLTDQHGRFEISGVIPGSYDVFLSLSPRGYGRTVASCRTEVRSGKTAVADPDFGDDGRKHRARGGDRGGVEP